MNTRSWLQRSFVHRCWRFSTSQCGSTEITKKDAERQLDYVRGLRIRLLGDRVLQNVAWKIADQLGWPDTLDAEYLALTQLQADAFITLNARLATAAKGLVTIAPIEELY